MSSNHRSRSTGRRLTLAVVAGIISGACRALVDRLLDHFGH
ncbi:hypothetical protein [Virgisporangium aurantiacum]|nr:hypothetical protein [Virgisporangium aurantiacum]